MLVERRRNSASADLRREHSQALPTLIAGGTVRAESLTIDFVGGRSGQGVPQFEVVRNHVRGEALSAESRQLVRARVVADDDVGTDAVRDQFVGHSHGHAFADAGMGMEDGLDLPELNAVAPALDLVVTAPEEFEVAVGQLDDDGHRSGTPGPFRREDRR